MGPIGLINFSVINKLYRKLIEYIKLELAVKLNKKMKASIFFALAILVAAVVARPPPE